MVLSYRGAAFAKRAEGLSLPRKPFHPRTADPLTPALPIRSSAILFREPRNAAKDQRSNWSLPWHISMLSTDTF